MEDFRRGAGPLMRAIVRLRPDRIGIEGSEGEVKE